MDRLRRLYPSAPWHVFAQVVKIDGSTALILFYDLDLSKMPAYMTAELAALMARASSARSSSSRRRAAVCFVMLPIKMDARGPARKATLGLCSCDSRARARPQRVAGRRGCPYSRRSRSRGCPAG